jgi:predicted O-methyltransferase YrrM
MGDTLEAATGSGSNWCLDLWRPLDDLTYEEALANIFPTKFEGDSGVIAREHLIDDYILSRNIARFGLKFTTNVELLKNLKDEFPYLWHWYTIKREDKVIQIRRVLLDWKIEKIDISRAIAIEGFMRPSELEWLAGQAASRKRIAEIGTYYGRTTAALAESCIGEVHTYDDFYGPRDIVIPEDIRAGIYDKFRKNLAPHLQSGRVIVHRESFKDVKPDGEYDLIFIDGSHEYRHFTADLDKWAPHLAKDGLLCGHDYDDGFRGISRALRERNWPVQPVPNTRIWKIEAAQIEKTPVAGLMAV